MERIPFCSFSFNIRFAIKRQQQLNENPTCERTKCLRRMCLYRTAYTVCNVCTTRTRIEKKAKTNENLIRRFDDRPWDGAIGRTRFHFFVCVIHSPLQAQRWLAIVCVHDRRGHRVRTHTRSQRRKPSASRTQAKVGAHVLRVYWWVSAKQKHRQRQNDERCAVYWRLAVHF